MRTIARSLALQHVLNQLIPANESGDSVILVIAPPWEPVPQVNECRLWQEHTDRSWDLGFLLQFLPCTNHWVSLNPAHCRGFPVAAIRRGLLERWRE
jgi:hypothetical protein